MTVSGYRISIVLNEKGNNNTFIKFIKFYLYYHRFIDKFMCVLIIVYVFKKKELRVDSKAEK